MLKQSALRGTSVSGVQFCQLILRIRPGYPDEISHATLDADDTSFKSQMNTEELLEHMTYIR